ncbi:calcium-binding EF hand family protein [Artemisia annua]|uniref:Calcium-binding EF hand family protein n=1 Tax=Artemisia annua TaxID=35608 RepID=A0A2U1MXN1_ARTAN|nr:calcium-binding EF hand family protein [Artemisia annua]
MTVKDVINLGLLYIQKAKWLIAYGPTNVNVILLLIWQHADQNRTGFLGRQEFYNALKLVTVAQSKRELTPDIVKAALYGPASSKIPAPQINLAALPPAQPNAMGPRPSMQQPGIANSIAPRPPTQQPGVVNSMQNQNFGIRSQGPPSSMAPPSKTKQLYPMLLFPLGFSDPSKLY